MSCLPDCGGSTQSLQEADSVEGRPAHDQSAYHPLSEASCLSEAIPLLPKDSTMIKYEADPECYEQLAVIGCGFNRSTIITLARHTPSGHRVAIRRTNVDICNEDITYIQQEILVTRQLRHENLLPYLCSFVCEDEVWVIMPLMPFGSARDILSTYFPHGLPEPAICYIFRDVLRALDYLHRRGFIHRSVKASHILISASGRAVLTGLRYSCNVVQDGRWHHVIHAFPSDAVSNLNWASPELLEQNLMGYNCKSDIYSLGIVACELANGGIPFADVSPTQMLLDKLQGCCPYPLDARAFPNNKDHMDETQRAMASVYGNRMFSEAFHTFVTLCLQRDPMRRPSASQLLQHTFVKQCKKTNITMLDLLSTVTPLIESAAVNRAGDRSVDMALNRMKTLDIEEPWNF